MFCDGRWGMVYIDACVKWVQGKRGEKLGETSSDEI